MEINIEIPFHKILKLIKTLSPDQKEKVRRELNQINTSSMNDKEEFIRFLLNGPVYTEKEIKTIEENRKSIATWREKE